MFLVEGLFNVKVLFYLFYSHYELQSYSISGFRDTIIQNQLLLQCPHHSTNHVSSHTLACIHNRHFKTLLALWFSLLLLWGFYAFDFTSFQQPYSSSWLLPSTTVVFAYLPISPWPTLPSYHASYNQFSCSSVILVVSIIVSDLIMLQKVLHILSLMFQVKIETAYKNDPAWI